METTKRVELDVEGGVRSLVKIKQGIFFAKKQFIFNVVNNFLRFQFLDTF